MPDSPEKRVYDWLVEKQGTSADENLLAATIQATVYARIGDGIFIRVGNCEAEMDDCGNCVDEIRVSTHLQILAAAGQEESLVIDARETVRNLTLKVAGLIRNQPDLNGRVADTNVGRIFRGWSKVATRLYATAIVPLEINPQ